MQENIHKNCAVSTQSYPRTTIVLYGRNDNEYRKVDGKLKRNRSGRFVININETVQAVKSAMPDDYEFEYVQELSKFSFCEQMRLFAKAKIFVSPEGAHLTLGTFLMPRDATLLVLYGHCKGQIKPKCPEDLCTGGGIAGPIWFTAAAHFSNLKVQKISFCLNGKYSRDNEAMVIEIPKLIYELEKVWSQ